MVRIRVLLILFGVLLFGTSSYGQVTSLTLNSDPGDFVGGGQFTFLTPSDGSFTASQNFDQGVSISFFGQPGVFSISGFFSVFVPCTGTTPWSVTIQTVPTLFHGRSVALFTGGKADVFATATAFDPDTGQEIQRNLSVTITLTGKN